MLLLTGGTGYLGQKILLQLAKTEQVLVLTRKETALKQHNIRYIVADLQDPKSLIGKFEHVTKVIHMASVTHTLDESLYWKINFEGTKNLLQALPKDITQFVYTSTTCAENNAGGYGESKLAVENLLKAQLKNLVILRIGDVFGGTGEKSLEQLISRVEKASIFPLIGDGHYGMAPVYADDVAVAIQKASTLKGRHQLVITGTEIWSFVELVSLIARIKNKKILTVPVPVAVLDLVIRTIASLGIGSFYPDQVKRFVVKKNLDSTLSWQKLQHTPKKFSTWLSSLSPAQN